jgi:8-oxo-dGTP pyrophosphatase MutT (NUDIX family)
MRKATIVLLLRKGEILLAMKKRGFGVGKWNGVGGKNNPGEEIEQTAIREAEEEIGVTPLNIKKVAVINFYFPKNPDWGQEVHVFTAVKWKGIPKESEEMKPKWFKIADIPYKQMWWDDEIWMAKILAGKLVRGSFTFEENEVVSDYKLEEVKSLN